MGLLAVVGPSAFRARSCSKVRRSRHSARISCSRATRSGFASTGRNIGPRGRSGTGAAVRRCRAAATPTVGCPGILPAMQRRQEARPRARSPFVAAFLSLLVPGLGHAYAGAYQRALGFAAPPILLVALLAGVFLRMSGTQIIQFVLTPWVLPGLFVLNLIALGYRL